MSKSPLIDLSIELSIQMVKFHEYLTGKKKEYIMSDQLLRSATSIGANIHEANYAVSKADFINKMQIALKEAAETEYWLNILENTGHITDEYSKLKDLCLSIKRILISTLKTSKSSVIKST